MSDLNIAIGEKNLAPFGWGRMRRRWAGSDPVGRRAGIAFTATVEPQMTIGDLSNATCESFVTSAGCQDALTRPVHREVAELRGPAFLKVKSLGVNG